MKEIFKPRDFVYLDDDKLDSYFSQLYGGLITGMSDMEQEEKYKESSGNGTIGLKGGVKTGKSSTKIFNVINKFIGAEVNIDTELTGNINRKKSNNIINNKTTTQVLSHFKYAMFEESIKESKYLIDLDSFIENKKEISSGIIRENLSSTDFIKFTASNIELRDYRNASEFVNLLKKIFEMAVDVKSGTIMDKGLEGINDKEKIRELSQMVLINKLFNNEKISHKSVKIFEVIVNVIDEVFKGDIVPLDIMLISQKKVKENGGSLKFESILKEKYLLENRLNLSFKYGTYEDANWTIIGQLTTTKYPEQVDFEKIITEYSNKFSKLSEEFKIDINEFVKTAIKEVDIFSKKVGLMPQLSSRHLGFTPIAIFRQPKVNDYFQDFR